MLILTRRVGETLMVGDDVTVTVLGVKGNQVRLGVNAPRNVAVHREGLHEIGVDGRVGLYACLVHHAEHSDRVVRRAEAPRDVDERAEDGLACDRAPLA